MHTLCYHWGALLRPVICRGGVHSQQLLSNTYESLALMTCDTQWDRYFKYKNVMLYRWMIPLKIWALTFFQPRLPLNNNREFRHACIKYLLYCSTCTMTPTSAHWILSTPPSTDQTHSTSFTYHVETTETRIDGYRAETSGTISKRYCTIVRSLQSSTVDGCIQLAQKHWG